MRWIQGMKTIKSENEIRKAKEKMKNKNEFFLKRRKSQSIYEDKEK